MAIPRRNKINAKGIFADPRIQHFPQAAKHVWYTYVSDNLHALKRNPDTIVWNVPPDLFLEMIQSRCAYCGREPWCLSKWAGVKMYYTGINRVETILGFTSGNIVPCCKTCSSMKGIRSVKVFIKHCVRLTKYNSSVSLTL